MDAYIKTWYNYDLTITEKQHIHGILVCLIEEFHGVTHVWRIAGMFNSNRLTIGPREKNTD